MNEEVKDLIELIRMEAKKIIKQELKSGRYIKTWVATVIAVDAGTNTATLLIPGQSTNIIKQNKTGQSLVVNDQVYIYSPTGELTNSYIGAVKKQYI